MNPGSAIAGVMLAVIAAATSAQPVYPSRTIRMVVAFGAGSATDIIGRAFADAMSKSMDRSIVVENRPGAGGTIAASAVAKSDPDGHTLLVHSSTHAINPAIYAKLPYDTLRDFTNVAGLGATPNVLIVPPGRYRDLRDFVAQIKSRPPNSLNYGSAGVGSGAHLNAEKFMMMAGIDLQHVPYNGTPEVVGEIAAGKLEFYMAPLNAAVGLIRDGRVQALGVSGAARSGLLPDVPPTIDVVPNSEYSLWIGLFVPSRTPANIVARLHAEAAKAAATPELRERLATMGAEAMPGTQSDFDRFVRSEMESTALIAKRARMQIQQ